MAGKINYKNKATWIIIAIILIGIFFRVYKFSEYLRFNPDQARDANIIKAALNGEADLPLLGPQAGGTEFRLGGIFYQLQFIAGKIFGSDPEKLAYSDLFFSILTIPLMYLFLRKYFNRNISLLSTGLLAVSFFAVKYSRFAWNPNSTPFWILLFLYALCELSCPEQKRKMLWAVILGTSLGIGMQLHSLLLVSLPLIALFYAVYLFRRKNSVWKLAPLILAIALLFNISQITSELKTGRKNMREFFSATTEKSERKGLILEKLALNVVCHIQSGGFIITGVGNDNECDFWDANKNFEKNSKKPERSQLNFFLLVNIIFSIVFSLGGYFLLVLSLKREKDPDKKRYLGIILLYAGIFFVLLVPLALEISMRFFLMLEFLPFVFLGFWIKFLTDRFGRKGFWIAVTIVATMIAINIYYIKNNFAYLAGEKESIRGGFNELTLSEAKGIAGYISSQSQGVGAVYLEGKASDIFKIIKPVKYFTNGTGLEVSEYKKGQIINSGEKVFLIDAIKNPKTRPEVPENAKYCEVIKRIKICEIIRQN